MTVCESACLRPDAMRRSADTRAPAGRGGSVVEAEQDYFQQFLVLVSTAVDRWIVVKVCWVMKCIGLAGGSRMPREGNHASKRPYRSLVRSTACTQRRFASCAGCWPVTAQCCASSRPCMSLAVVGHPSPVDGHQKGGRQKPTILLLLRVRWCAPHTHSAVTTPRPLLCNRHIQCDYTALLRTPCP
jgi:hypothetical protein